MAFDFDISGNSFEVEANTATVNEGTNDHRELTNRNAANQHPISAITDLQTALDGKAGTDTVPTKTSDLENDSEFITEEALDGYAT